MSRPVIAICEGHDPSAQGAVAPWNASLTEYKLVHGIFGPLLAAELMRRGAAVLHITHSHIVASLGFPADPVTGGQELIAGAKLANEAKADYAFDLHFNTAESDAVEGFWACSGAGASDREVKLATAIAGRMRAFNPSSRHYELPRERSGWARHVACPALVLEFGFLTNRNEIDGLLAGRFGFITCLAEAIIKECGI